MKRLTTIAIVAALSALCACEPTETTNDTVVNADEPRVVVYQVFTRLFGNTNENRIPWGTIEQNGVGKFSDFTPEALESIKALGTTHIWYTGVPHHGVINDYTDYGISLDDPDVIKGRAGSPYAVRDYYNVNPDLADNPAERLAEFEALIARTHEAGMKVVIDIVPNHVARNYQSLSAPEGISDFGEHDDTSIAYARDNNFYYLPGEPFIVPDFPSDERPLNGEAHPLSDGFFEEIPAKWTGNGARLAQPNYHDWYETVKVNYGVRPDGSYDFATLGESFRTAPNRDHVEFWASQDVPDSWRKFRDITQYWLDKGVDGFRYDMAEMVPVEFWSYLNTQIKESHPDSFLLAEVYNPSLYRDYLELGRMDALYDKVGFYDSLKLVMQDRGSVSDLLAVHSEVLDISDYLLHFLENHDEQRIASDEFAGDARIGRPAMLVSAAISRSPTLLYFAQDVGEDGMLDAGFGKATRTTIFDYWGVPAHQRYMNDGRFDGGRSTPEEISLRGFYEILMPYTSQAPMFLGDYTELHTINLGNGTNYTERQMAFVRESRNEAALVIANFADTSVDLELDISYLGQRGFDTISQALFHGTSQLYLDRSSQRLRVTIPAHHGEIIEFEKAQ